MAVHSSYKTLMDKDIDKFIDELNDYLDDYTSETIGKKAQEIVDEIFKKSQTYVPEDTGRTKESWFQEIEIDKSGVLVLFGYDKNGEIEYLPLIHAGFTKNGTMNFKKPSARPRFFARAIEEVLPEARKKLGVDYV